MTPQTGADDPRRLLRADLAGFAGYASARQAGQVGDTWLNANESPWSSPADPGGQSRRYPDPQPAGLRADLAAVYGCQPGQLLATRGSDEAIDLLVRALCRPGADSVVITPPSFGMYAICARLHGTGVVQVPLVDSPSGFQCDFQAVERATLESGAKLVFLCSPGNPTGTVLPLQSMRELAAGLQGRALVVVDEAYAEFADGASAVSLLEGTRNLAVLRTLSKAHALAGARIGCVIADAGLVPALQHCQAPYPLPAPSIAIACRALGMAARRATDAGIARLRSERDRVQAALQASSAVTRVYPSQANFLLVRFRNAAEVFDQLLDAGIVVRDQRHMPGLDDALRITVGSEVENDRVIQAIQGRELTA